MGSQTERRRYYPEEENVPVSVAVVETIRDHDEMADDAEEDLLSDYVDPDALNRLVTSVSINFRLQFHLPSATVTVWRDGSVDIRVTATDE